MATLAEIREGLRANLAAAIDDVQISAYKLANPTPPSIQVLYPDEVEYHEAMNNGLNSWTLIVIALAGSVSDIGAQQLLDAFIPAAGASSVKAAIEADKTLGGKVGDLIVRKCSGYREYAVDPTGQRPPLLGAAWTVVVTTNGG